MLRRLGLSKFTQINDLINTNKTYALPTIEIPPEVEDKYLKAVKSDDAQVETWVWDTRVLKLFKHVEYNDKTVSKLNVLRRLALKY